MFVPSSLLERLITLTRDLVLIPSTESRPQERARCFAVLRAHLETAGHVRLREFVCNGRQSLVATPPEEPNPKILMVGHLDVIDHPDLSVYQSRVRDGRIHGPGAGDMKGQLAIMVELFVSLQRAHPGASLGIAVTSDEEIGGCDGVRHLFEDAGLRCDSAIVPDGGSIKDITIAEKGILHARLRCRGQESHAARPWLAANALLRLNKALSRVLAEFETLQSGHEDSADHWHPTCVPTVMRTANETINCIPGEAHACVDVRFPPPHTVASMLARLRAAAGPETEVDVLMAAEPTQLAPDPLYLEVTSKLTGSAPNLVRASGGSDARFIASRGIPVVLSRPLVGALHSPDEWIDINSMGLYFRICEEFARLRLDL